MHARGGLLTPGEVTEIPDPGEGGRRPHLPWEEPPRGSGRPRSTVPGGLGPLRAGTGGNEGERGGKEEGKKGRGKEALKKSGGRKRE